MFRYGTGISTKFGHRIIEIGMMDITGRKMGDTWQKYLQPDRSIDEGAQAVRITQEFLADKPRFSDVAKELLMVNRRHAYPMPV